MLWADRPLPDAIRAAAAAGFDAVECHWPYDTAPADLRVPLDETGLRMVGLNTAHGDVAADEFGLSAVPGRQVDARAAVDQALDYAAALGARHVHVMAGNANGPDAEAAFLATLSYACDHPARDGRAILIEPLNRVDAPEYFLRDTAQAEAILDRLAHPALRIMLDCYHVGRTEGDPLPVLSRLLPKVGHIQFAAVPDRGPPDHGDLDYGRVFKGIAALGWTAPLGAEYRPGPDTDATLGWMAAFRDDACHGHSQSRTPR